MINNLNIVDLFENIQSAEIVDGELIVITEVNTLSLCSLKDLFIKKLDYWETNLFPKFFNNLIHFRFKDGNMYKVFSADIINFAYKDNGFICLTFNNINYEQIEQKVFSRKYRFNYF